MNKLDLKLLRRLLGLAVPYWKSEERAKAWGYLGLLGLLLIGYTWSGVQFNQYSGEFTSALAAKDSDRFWHAIRVFSLLLVVAVPIYSFYYYVRDKLSILWRRWLTDRVLRSYFANRSFYRLLAMPEIDNPDQRVAEDISTFTSQSLNYLLLFASAAFELLAFSKVLWAISKPLVFFLVLYAAVGTLVTIGYFSGRMISLYFERLRREADFRFGLVRIRENAESIALYHGEDQERAQVQRRFGSVYGNFMELINWGLRLNFFSYSYSLLTLALPSIIIAPRVLTGELEVGRVVQAAGAFSAILAALNVFVTNLEYLSRFAAGVERLDSFVRRLESESSQSAVKSKIVTRIADDLRFDRITLQTPGYERTLVKELTLDLEPGKGLMIVGPSGCGKSSLLRAIAGLWDAGSGTLVRPQLDDMLFLPQHAYMILGTLRGQLLYPKLNRKLTDDELHQVLEDVRLPNLIARCGGLDADSDLEKVLSVGERQRVAFARVLLHRPRYVLLDEATSALDQENETALYRLLTAMSATIVSVSHHSSLLRFHSHVLELDGEGAWQSLPAANYRIHTEDSDTSQE
ncbi:MAG: ABC transporter ATP-binding protein/permease [Bryobacteraceae bacterium]